MRIINFQNMNSTEAISESGPENSGSYSSLAFLVPINIEANKENIPTGNLDDYQ